MKTSSSIGGVGESARASQESGATPVASCTPEDRAVMRHLVVLIQESPDVRYFVGGYGTQMRELLCAAIKATGYEGDPVEVLRPPAHRRDDEARHQRLERELDGLREAARSLRADPYDDDKRHALQGLL